MPFTFILIASFHIVSPCSHLEVTHPAHLSRKRKKGGSESHSVMSVCDPMDCSLPGSSIHGILQARILEWVAIPFSQRSSLPRNRTLVSCIANRFFTCEQPGKPIVGGGGILLSSRSIWAFHDTTAAAAAANALQSCPTLCDPIDGSPLGSPVPGILQARTLEWVAISFSNA